MKTLSDRFRTWYAYERDCNAKTLEMLASVPVEKRTSPEFQKAVNRLGHLLAARRLWLYRFGRLSEAPRLHPKDMSFDSLPELVAATEELWVEELAKLEDSDLSQVLDVHATNGRHYRWSLEQILTQLFGHAFYHRGQIVQLVASLGGKTFDTDYILWNDPPARI